MTLVHVSLLGRGEEDAWDHYVRAAPQATFFHLSGWRRVIEEAFGHDTYYFCARRAGTIVGVMPLTHVRSLLFGNALISNAFCVYGGIVADDEAAHRALATESIKLGREKKVAHIECRSVHPSPLQWHRKDDLYVTFRKPIDPNLDANLKAIPRKQRAMVRKGITNGLCSVLDENADRLHEIYAHSVRNLGTPVFSKRYFELLKTEFGENCDILTVLQGDTPIASVMNFYFRDEVLPYYGGGLREARALAANDFMYWEVLRRACERGYRLFDFGRSKRGTGSYNFKRYWGFEPTPLHYEYFPITKERIPDLNPLNPKYQALIATWKRLPVPLTKVLGPPIVRGIG